eukprot:9469706-Pyramimonas_sp.AAC.1
MRRDYCWASYPFFPYPFRASREPELSRTFIAQMDAPSATPYVEAPTVPAQWLPCPCASAAHVLLKGEHTVSVPGYVPEAATSTPAKARPPNSLCVMRMPVSNTYTCTPLPLPRHSSASTYWMPHG